MGQSGKSSKSYSIQARNNLQIRDGSLSRGLHLLLVSSFHYKYLYSSGRKLMEDLPKKEVGEMQNPLQLFRSESARASQKKSSPQFHISLLPGYSDIVTGAVTTLNLEDEKPLEPKVDFLSLNFNGASPGTGLQDADNLLEDDTQEERPKRKKHRTSYHIHSKPKPRKVFCGNRLETYGKKSKIPLLGFNRTEYGEELLYENSTQFVLKSRSSHIEGTLIVTNYKIVFVPMSEDFLRITGISKKFFSIPNSMVSKIDKVFEKKMLDCFFIDISTKDRRNLRFCFSLEEFDLKKGDISLILSRACFPSSSKLSKQFFAYDYKLKYEDSQEGWEVYDPILEFIRQGVGLYIEQDGLATQGRPGTHQNFSTDELSPSQISSSPGSPFRLSFANVNYKMSPTYPSLLMMPKTITDEDMHSACQFRTKERLPALTWYSEKYGSSIWRSSQSKAGLMTSRSVDDQKLLLEIAKTVTAKKHHPGLMIYDARSYMAAFGNKIAGKGYESKNHYKYCDVVFCDIDNIHAVREAYKRMKKLTNEISEQAVRNTLRTKFLSALEHSGWLQTLSSILSGSVKAANSIKEGKCILVHCSDGWDRTSQIASLVQLLLDPYYRTLKGFQVLVEKDWVHFGHQFQKRSGHGNRNHKDEDRSPVFVQWLDCIHQLIVQYPTSFEFNGRLLAKLAHHVYSCKYGTFLYNCMSQREGLETKSISIWSQVARRGHKYENPFYVPNNAELEPSCVSGKLRFWEEHFMKWNGDWNSSYQIVAHGISSPQAHIEALMWDARTHQDMKKNLDKEVQKLKRTVQRYEEVFKKRGIELDSQELKSMGQQPESAKEEENGTILSGRIYAGDQEDLTEHVERDYVHSVAVDQEIKAVDGDVGEQPQEEEI